MQYELERYDMLLGGRTFLLFITMTDNKHKLTEYPP